MHVDGRDSRGEGRVSQIELHVADARVQSQLGGNDTGELSLLARERRLDTGVGARGAQRRQIHDDILEIAHAAGSIRLLEPRLQLGFGELVVGVMALQ